MLRKCCGNYFKKKIKYKKIKKIVEEKKDSIYNSNEILPKIIIPIANSGLICLIMIITNTIKIAEITTFMISKLTSTNITRIMT